VEAEGGVEERGEESEGRRKEKDARELAGKAANGPRGRKDWKGEKDLGVKEEGIKYTPRFSSVRKTLPRWKGRNVKRQFLTRRGQTFLHFSPTSLLLSFPSRRRPLVEVGARGNFFARISSSGQYGTFVWASPLKKSVLFQGRPHSGGREFSPFSKCPPSSRCDPFSIAYSLDWSGPRQRRRFLLSAAPRPISLGRYGDKKASFLPCRAMKSPIDDDGWPEKETTRTTRTRTRTTTTSG